MRIIEDEARAATNLTMEPTRLILQRAEDDAKAACNIRQSEYLRKWTKVYNEILAELKEDQDAGH
jgi:hypothetical protein